MNIRMIVAALAVPSLLACGTSTERSPGGDASTVSDTKQQAGATADAALTAAPIPEGCDLIPRAEVERVAGKIQ